MIKASELNTAADFQTIISKIEEYILANQHFHSFEYTFPTSTDSATKAQVIRELLNSGYHIDGNCRRTFKAFKFEMETEQIGLGQLIHLENQTESKLAENVRVEGMKAVAARLEKMQNSLLHYGDLKDEDICFTFLEDLSVIDITSTR